MHPNRTQKAERRIQQTCSCTESEKDEQLSACPPELTNDSLLSETLGVGELTVLLLGEVVGDKTFPDNGHTFLVRSSGSSMSSSCKQYIIEGVLGSHLQCFVYHEGSIFTKN